MNAGKYIKRNASKAGFTIMETLVAASLSSMVLIAVMGSFLWCGEQAVLCSKMAWSQREAMSTSTKLISYIRNASSIVDIDEEHGQWVTLAFPDSTVCTLIYSNAIPLLRDGRLYLNRTDGSDMVVTRGMTEIMTDGFSQHIFTGEPGGGTLRVAYRISEPAASGGKAADDGNFSVEMRFSAYLRNVGG